MKSGKQNFSLIASLSALGVVYGDIGTSPLYAFKESFHHTHDLALSALNVYGILSLIFWSLIIVVSIKYLVFIVKADNQGEGGVLALTALLATFKVPSTRVVRALTLFGLFGTALLYGDGMITPAISVLSAVEGLEFINPGLHPYILPITVVILVGLFSIQRHGTAVVGRIFGPVTLVWFLVLGLLGITQIIDNPGILTATNPFYAFDFFQHNSWKAFTVLGSVFLVVTGGEALYSDLGHFGKAPIRFAWFSTVLPCLILNYFGQGALLLSNPKAISNPFFLMAPSWALIPLVALATISTCIASQALITGVFSLTMQAVQLQYIPRVSIDHTSFEEFGQIYVKTVNTLLMVACIALVLTFKSSSNLAAAYGIAVTTTMVITTVLFYFVAIYAWKWNKFFATLLCLFFLIIEGSFWGANLMKLFAGGWFPLLVGLGIFTLMTTWNKGRQILSERMLEYIIPLQEFLDKVREKNPVRVPGVAIYMSGHPQYVPPTLYQSFRHFNCIHEHLVLLAVHTVDIPHVPPSNRVRLQDIGPHIYKVSIDYGFMDLPDIPAEMKGLRLDDNHPINPDTATYFLGREHIIANQKEGMALWRERLFALMSRNAQPATRFFQLPRDRVVEIGSVVEL